MDNQSPEVAALRNGENGILFKENSSKDLARRMMELISNESLRMPMSAQALVTAQEEFTLPQMVKRFWDATCAAASLRSESCLDTGQ
jgi:glycosyltransferase involved in cell wall biosynthesis